MASGEVWGLSGGCLLLGKMGQGLKETRMVDREGVQGGVLSTVMATRNGAGRERAET
jgi:hypothetical protein